MSEQDIFTTEVVADQPVATPVDISTNVLVGEGKKYATVDDLAKAYYNADSFIETLKEENRALRDQVSRVAELDATLDRMQAKASSLNTPREEEVQGVPVDASSIAEMVEQTLTKREAENVLKNNMKLADEKLRAVFGDKAKEVFTSQTSNPALRNTLTTLAQTDPDAFVNYFVNAVGIKKQESTSVVDGVSKVNTVNLASVYGNRANDPDTRDYYAHLRKTNPTLYYSQDVQIKMQKAALNNPQKYFS